MRDRNNKAFTLIELLVVIGIISILAMLLFPVFGRVRESGRNARCSSNLHQLQLAVVNFAGGMDGSVPYSASFARDNGDWTTTHIPGWVAWYNVAPYMLNPAGGQNAWYGQNAIPSITNGSLWAYINNLDVYICPTFGTKTVSGRNDAKRSYGMNSAISGVNMLGMTSISTMLFCDDAGMTNNPSNNTDAQCLTNGVGSWHPFDAKIRGKGNVVYLDGHVERR
jgi:prepilin-type N-terminal cleavage/methylation domain-containing protein/prepilin-type processing-associated H-X9-DG protein